MIHCSKSKLPERKRAWEKAFPFRIHNKIHRSKSTRDRCLEMKFTICRYDRNAASLMIRNQMFNRIEFIIFGSNLKERKQKQIRHEREIFLLSIFFYVLRHQDRQVANAWNDSAFVPIKYIVQELWYFLERENRPDTLTKVRPKIRQVFLSASFSFDSLNFSLRLNDAF